MSPIAEQPDPDAIAAAVTACPSVSGLSGGVAGEIATYLPGRRVTGVRVNPGSVEVHVVARYGAPLQTLDSEVRAAVQAAAPVFGGQPLTVDVIVADVENPFAPDEDEQQPTPELEAGPSAQSAALPPAPPTSPAPTGPAAGPVTAGAAASPATSTGTGPATSTGPLSRGTTSPTGPPTGPATPPVAP
jgi:uncharacterized alkaline shock family protein YloU